MPVERRYIDQKWQKVNILNEADSGEQCSEIDSFAGKTRMFILKQNDSTHLPLPPKSIDFVVTDPPYFDSVQYSDLSHFFRCWLRAFLPDSAQWNYISTSSAVAESSNIPDKFGNVLSDIWKECVRVLRTPHGRLIFTYHHWNPVAWAQLTVSLKKANFFLANRFVVHSENPTSVHIVNLRALKHDVILVLKPGVMCKRNWTKPQPFVDSDSYGFCKACGQMIGWLLENDFSETEISEQWHCHLKGLD
jgi:adenine-specific DNA methylase